MLPTIQLSLPTYSTSWAMLSMIENPIPGIIRESTVSSKIVIPTGSFDCIFQKIDCFLFFCWNLLVFLAETFIAH